MDVQKAFDVIYQFFIQLHDHIIQTIEGFEKRRNAIPPDRGSRLNIEVRQSMLTNFNVIG